MGQGKVVVSLFIIKSVLSQKALTSKTNLALPRRQTFATKILEMASCEPRKYGIALFQNGVGKTVFRSAQEKKEFACPQ
jgi:hypothetical protein